MELSNCRIVRSARRTLSIEISREGEVIVRVPNRCSQREIEAFVEKYQAWAEEKLRLRREREEAFPPPDKETVEELRRQAKEYLPGRVAYFSGKMGLAPTAVRITSARTRFGSCSGRNSIAFSCLLMRYPSEAIDYVVVHELAHIARHDHSPAFHALVASILPDHLERRALLKKAPVYPRGILAETEEKKEKR